MSVSLSRTVVTYAPGTRSERKHVAIVDAAAHVFLHSGYSGASMDEIAGRSGVSKQTVYKHFAGKEDLFTAVIGQMMGEADLAVHQALPDIRNGHELETFLLDYGKRLLGVALTPSLMQLRRLVIAEAERFPELARDLYARGPKRALEAMAEAFEKLAERKLLEFEDAGVAASQLNWLLLGEPVNRIMMLGKEAIPTRDEINRHVAAAIHTFLAAYLHDDQRP